MPASTATTSPAPLRLDVTSEPARIAEVRRAIEAYAEAVGLSEPAAAEVGLVVNEAVANVIRHAYQNEPGRPIRVEAELVDVQPAGGRPADGQSAGLRVRIRDWGVGTVPDRVRTRDYVPGVPGGLGLVCLKQMMDSVEYAPQPDGGMLLTMTKRKV